VLEAWPGHPLLGSLGFGGEKAVTQGLEAFCVLLIKPYFWWGGGGVNTEGEDCVAVRTMVACFF
jgi:hypothetical protein